MAQIMININKVRYAHTGILTKICNISTSLYEKPFGLLERYCSSILK